MEWLDNIWLLAQGKVVKECVRRKDYIENNRTRLLVDLNPGNYCVQVRAFSKAGPGPPTKETCFLIEVYFAFLSFQKKKNISLHYYPNLGCFFVKKGNIERTKWQHHIGYFRHGPFIRRPFNWSDRLFRRQEQKEQGWSRNHLDQSGLSQYEPWELGKKKKKRKIIKRNSSRIWLIRVRPRRVGSGPRERRHPPRTGSGLFRHGSRGSVA